MPVMVFYKDKSVSVDVAKNIAESLSRVTKTNLDASIEVRVLEPQYSYNSNEVHIEVKFRDFNEYSNEKLSKYHEQSMQAIGDVLRSHKIKCSYSFYIIPTQTPRSMWAQDKS